jgi:hypothetical protein
MAIAAILMGCREGEADNPMPLLPGHLVGQSGE